MPDKIQERRAVDLRNKARARVHETPEVEGGTLSEVTNRKQFCTSVTLYIFCLRVNS